MTINCPYPTIDMEKTGENIKRLCKAAGYSVTDIQVYFGFNNPQSIYKWQRGKSVPSVDNLFALARLLHVKVDDIVILTGRSDGRIRMMTAYFKPVLSMGKAVSNVSGRSLYPLHSAATAA